MKKALLTIFALLLMANVAEATDTPAPLTGGTIQVGWGVPNSADLLDGASVAMVAEGGDPLSSADRVFCMDVDSSGEVRGDTTAIPKTAETVYTVAYAFSGPGCTGLISTVSLDRYVVTFGPPGAPFTITITVVITP